MKISNAKFGFLCSMPGVVGLLALLLYPITYSIYVSFLKYDNIRPVMFSGFENYRWILSSADFYHSLRVSTIYGLGSTGLALGLGLVLAHSLHRITKGGGVFRTLSILPWAAPLVISGFMWKWMFSTDMGIINHLLRRLGIVNENIEFLCRPYLSLISGMLATSWSYAPFMTVLLLAGLESIPGDVYEAAGIDGADQLQKFWHISLPLNKHQVLIASLIIFMFTFRTPDIFFSLTGGGPAKFTYHVGLFLLSLMYRYLRFGRAGALSILLFMIILGFVFPVLYYGIMKRSKS